MFSGLDDLYRTDPAQRLRVAGEELDDPDDPDDLDGDVYA